MENQMKKQERITKKHIAEILEMPLESILETAKIHADEHARLGCITKNASRASLGWRLLASGSG